MAFSLTLSDRFNTLAVVNLRKVHIFRFKGQLLLFAVVALFLSAVDTRADLFTSCGIDLGKAGRTKKWAAFTLGGGMKDSDYTGQANIFGDVGAAGNGDVDLTGNAVIHGDLWYRTNGTLKVKNNGTVTGTTYHDAAHDAFLDQGVQDAMNASNQAWALSPTQSLTKIDKSMTITGSGCVVLRLTDFTLNNNDTLTLQATAPNTAFIINVKNQFSLNDNAKIVLSGGLTWDSVLFNVRGTGPEVTLQKKSKLMGILMANQRNVTIKDNAYVGGEVIANHIDLNNNGIINASP
jgi:choice-of-anchor A domain-containing protein